MQQPGGSVEDDRMVEFALRWMPYGGGHAEDIVVDFGISPHEFFTRLHAVLNGRSCPPHLDPHAKAALRAICTHRIRASEQNV